MTIDTKKLKDLIALLRKSGVTSFEHDGLKLSFSGDYIPPRRRRKKNGKEIEEIIPVTHSYTDEEIVYWSSGGIPDESQGTKN